MAPVHHHHHPRPDLVGDLSVGIRQREKAVGKRCGFGPAPAAIMAANSRTSNVRTLLPAQVERARVKWRDAPRRPIAIDINPHFARREQAAGFDGITLR